MPGSLVGVFHVDPRSNVRRRVLKPAGKGAEVAWIGFYTRQTCASMLFGAGRNVKQVQEWLGHSDPGFTLRTYIHLMDEGIGAAIDLEAELSHGDAGKRRIASALHRPVNTAPLSTIRPQENPVVAGLS